MGCCSSDLAAGEQSPRLHVGDVIPRFTLKHPDGSVFDSAKALEEGHLVVSFFRGHWCPFDQRQLGKLQENAKLIASLGGSVVAVCPQHPKFVQKSVDKHEAVFPVVSDPDNVIGKRFGIVHHTAPAMSATHPFAEWHAFVDENTNEEKPGRAMYPYPCTYVVERKTGRILAAHVEEADTVTRMPIDDIIAALRSAKNV